jgi:hypothetical protein
MNSEFTRTNYDRQPYIAKKHARIARSGNQIYMASEVRNRDGFVDNGKSYFVEHRPADVLIASKNKFGGVAFVNEHTPSVGSSNWKDHVVGFVGDNIGVETHNDEVWLTADLYFYDQKAYDDYEAGKVEVSACYDAKFKYTNGTRTDCDTIVTEIANVNHVALCKTARAGHDARILDSINSNGGYCMKFKSKTGFLSGLFGIGKRADENFKFSTVLMDSIAKAHTLDAAGLEKMVGDVLSHVEALGDSEPREFLVGAVQDCFKHPVEVLAQKAAVSEKIDGLYERCQNADAETVSRIFDSEKEEEGGEEDESDDKTKKLPKKKGDGKETKKDSEPENFEARVDAAFTKAFEKLSGDIDTRIDAAFKKALGGDDDDSSKKEDSRETEDSTTTEDASYLVRGIFGV